MMSNRPGSVRPEAASRATERVQLDRLEPRYLLSHAYQFQTLDEFFGLDFRMEVAPPDNFDPALGMGVAAFGHAAVGLGDIDGDGRGDFAIAATGRTAADGSTEISGKVFVYSGADGAVIRALGDGFADFGFALANLGDVSGDGISDLLVGSPRFDADADAAVDSHGRAYVVSGANGSIIRTFTGAGDADELGFAVAAAGLLDGDAVPDLLVGAPGAGSGGEGRVLALSGADGSGLVTFTGEAAGDRFGHAVAGAGDVRVSGMGDGVPEILIGAPLNDAEGPDAGRAYLFDGSTKALRFTFDDGNAGDSFGTAVAAVNNGLFVGAPGFDATVFGDQRIDAGRIWRYLADGSTDDEFEVDFRAGHRLGAALRNIGDFNGDRIDDLIAGVPGASGETVRLFAAGLFRFFFSPEAERLVQDRLFGLGDVSGDGVLDMLTLNVGDGAAALFSSFAIDPPHGIQGASPSLNFVFSSAGAIPSINRSRFAFIDGVYTPFSEIPGIGDDGTILGVNDAGLIIGAEVISAPGGPPFVEPGRLFIVENGIRTFLDEAALNIIGGQMPDFTAFGLVEVGPDGSILFVEDIGDDVRSWLLKGTDLTFLWSGRAFDANASGALVGHQTDAPHPILRAPDGTITELTQLVTVGSIADDGTIGGTVSRLSVPPELINGDNNTPRIPALLRDGQITVLQTATPIDGTFSSSSWGFRGLDESGNALLGFATTAGRQMNTETYVRGPDGLLHRLFLVTFGGPEVDEPRVLLEQGHLLSPFGIFVALEPPLPWTAEAGTSINPAQGAAIPTVGVHGELGDVLVLSRESDEWTGRLLRLSTPFDIAVEDVLTYVDPGDGQTYTFALAEGKMYFGDATGPLAPFFDAPGYTAIVEHAAVFISVDGRAHIAGTDANGDLVIYYEQGDAVPGSFTWTYDNLTQTHLESQGKTFVPVAGDLTAYVAPWGASHLAYLDDAGNVQVVWWAPETVFWTTTNLTEVAGATPLHGRITSYVTPWGGLNVAGTDLDGNLVALWWVPGFGGQWRFDRLAGDEAARLDPETITSYVTPWGGLNIAGLHRDSGEVTAYWWTPATSVWTTEAIAIPSAPGGFAISGPLTSAITGGGTQNLFGRADDGEIVRLFWDIGDGNEWNYESVTEQLLM